MSAVGDMFQFSGELFQESVFNVNRKHFTGFMWVASLDKKTCLECIPLDGKIWTEGPNDGDGPVVFPDGDAMVIEGKPPPQPLHPNCRCVMVPVMKGMEEQYRSPSYAEWLSRRNDEELMDILGPSRFRLWKAGYRISDFLRDGRVLTLKEMGQKRLFRKTVRRRLADGTLTDGIEPPAPTVHNFPTIHGRIQWERLSRDEVHEALAFVTGLPVENIDLSKMSIELRNMVAPEIEAMFLRYPMLRAHVTRIGMETARRKGSLAFVRSGKELHFDPSGMSSRGHVESVFNKAVELGHFPAGTNARGIIPHEIGHLLDEILSNRLHNSSIVNSDAWRTTYSFHLLRDARAQFGIRAKQQKQWLRDNLSGYATTDALEFLSEALNEFHTSPNPRPLASWVGRRVMDDLRRLGL